MVPFLDIKDAGNRLHFMQEEEVEWDSSPLDPASELPRAAPGVVLSATGRWAVVTSVMLLFVGTTAWVINSPRSRTGEQRQAADDRTLGHGGSNGRAALIGQKFGGSAPLNNYDCAASADNWQEAWSDLQKEYCCKSIQVGCVQPPNYAMWILLGVVIALVIFGLVTIGIALKKRWEEEQRSKMFLPIAMTEKPKERCCDCLGRDDNSRFMPREERGMFGFGSGRGRWFSGGRSC
uniref:Uncharacterized protein n=1 Tax=Alexandrium catenella TaxID=2925 RepID=A0A7S1Q4X6_ALECA|mmetsp:Transcript_18983/g.51602  ORF Transcript_18983/g.51602 Transcript_18983/m.51602 type:complete len:235 (+) Transcript_18983:39-743(+)